MVPRRGRPKRPLPPEERAFPRRVTLLPDVWAWLLAQEGNASRTISKLVRQAQNRDTISTPPKNGED